MTQKNDIPGIGCLELFRVFERIDILDNWNEKIQLILTLKFKNIYQVVDLLPGITAPFSQTTSMERMITEYS